MRTGGAIQRRSVTVRRAAGWATLVHGRPRRTIGLDWIGRTSTHTHTHHPAMQCSAVRYCAAQWMQPSPSGRSDSGDRKHGKRAPVGQLKLIAGERPDQGHGMTLQAHCHGVHAKGIRTSRADRSHSITRGRQTREARKEKKWAAIARRPNGPGPGSPQRLPPLSNQETQREAKRTANSERNADCMEWTSRLKWHGER